jgi:hypothetical protein
MRVEMTRRRLGAPSFALTYPRLCEEPFARSQSLPRRSQGVRGRGQQIRAALRTVPPGEVASDLAPHRSLLPQAGAAKRKPPGAPAAFKCGPIARMGECSRVARLAIPTAQICSARAPTKNLQQVSASRQRLDEAQLIGKLIVRKAAIIVTANVSVPSPNPMVRSAFSSATMFTQSVISRSCRSGRRVRRRPGLPTE